MFCPKCGKGEVNDSGICPECGFAVASGPPELEGARQSEGDSRHVGLIPMDYTGPSDERETELPAWRQELSRRLQEIKRKRETGDHPSGLSEDLPPLPRPKERPQAEPPLQTESQASAPEPPRRRSSSRPRPVPIPRNAIMACTFSFCAVAVIHYVGLVSQSLLFELAGISFFMSYALAVAGYTKRVSQIAGKIFGMGTFVGVSLVFINFGTTIIYPIAFYALGLLIHQMSANRRRKGVS